MKNMKHRMLCLFMVCLLFLSSCTQSGALTESTEAPPQTETAAETAASSEAPETEPEKEE